MSLKPVGELRSPSIRLKTLIFDLDGTLTDPREGITRCLAHALETLGHPAPPLSALEKYIGPPVYDVFKVLLETENAQKIQNAIRIYRERFSEVWTF